MTYENYSTNKEEGDCVSDVLPFEYCEFFCQDG